MDYENDNWTDDVLASMKGSSRAKPKKDLFSNIEAIIDQKSTRLIPLRQIRLAGIAACFLLIANSFAIYYTIKESPLEVSGQLAKDLLRPQYVTNYQIYE